MPLHAAIQRIQRLWDSTGFSQIGRAGVHRRIYPIGSAPCGCMGKLRTKTKRWSGSLTSPVTNKIMSTSSTQIVPFLRREALCCTRRLNAPARSSAFVVSCRAPGSSAGLPEYLTMTPGFCFDGNDAKLCVTFHSGFGGAGVHDAEVQSVVPLPRRKACALHTRRRQEPKPSGRLCPLPGLGRLERNRRHTRTNSRY